MSTSKIDKLPPTKLQIRLLNVFVDELGWGGGVHSLYRHLQREFGKDRIHPAMDDNGNVLFENGEFWEEKHLIYESTAYVQLSMTLPSLLYPKTTTESCTVPTCTSDWLVAPSI